jgi:hypothetical protein
VTTSREDSISENGAELQQATSEEVKIAVCEQQRMQEPDV